MNKTLQTLLLISLFVIGCQQQAPTISNEVKENIRIRVDEGINNGIIVGVINSKGSTFFSYGYKSYQNKEPIDRNSVFEIASISKTFTGIMLADMVHQKVLSLNDPLQSILPEGVNAPTKNLDTIRLIHLANHTSGLPRMPSNFNYTSLVNPFANYTEKQSYEFLNNYDLTGTIGKQYEYSNYGFGLLGHRLADLNGMNYNELLQAKICEPLKLYNTNTIFTPDMKANLAKGHKLGVEIGNWDYQSCFAGAGGIRSTAKDMLKYLAYNMGLESCDISEAIKTSHINSREKGEMPSIGLGWQLKELDSTQIVWHDGETGGYRSFIGFVKNRDKGVVVLTNSNTDINDIGFHLLDPRSDLNKPKPSIGMVLRNIISKQGIHGLEKYYFDLRNLKKDEHEFDENELHMLGTLYLDQNDVSKALAVFQINKAAFPNSSDALYDYGKALTLNNKHEEAIIAFKKSVELHTGNMASLMMLEKLGVNSNLSERIVIEDSVLESYIGKYELLTGLVLEVVKENNQLSTKAKGKSEHLIYPKSKKVFYYKSLPAQITFNPNEKGVVTSLTFIQEGEEIIAKRIEDHQSSRRP